MTPVPGKPGGRNWVLWIAIGVPTLTVCASALTLYLAVSRSEPELPPQYHWEGAALDQDIARADAARRLGAQVHVDFTTPGTVQAQLRFAPGSTAARPAELQLRLTHATLPALDRSVRLVLDPASGSYAARLDALPTGHWLVQLDGGTDWRLRGEFDSPAQGWALGL
ncbi:MAG: FixH family protein [Steroidobacteraceae bacterium]